MSRIGNAPIPVPERVKVNIAGSSVEVTGPNGKLGRVFPSSVKVKVAGDKLHVSRTGEGREEKALHGLSRSLLANMVEGVSTGFEKILEMRGVGYRAQAENGKLVMNLGYSHSIEVKIPEGISVEVIKKPVVEQLATTQLVIKGNNKEELGGFAAGIKKLRMPEPYKGKGIRYEGEYVRRKAGKKAA